ncbi:hypothetical protein ACFW9V_23010, partial [Streptomyces hygroscopicus]
YSSGDPRIGWIAAVDSLSATAPVLLQRRDGILPAVAAALSIRGETRRRRGERRQQLRSQETCTSTGRPSARCSASASW